ncbi:globin domain-containing protein [Tropicimonas sp. IMCC34043]|uniref:globin domain-containing protein n=1 Tax=Tropicimonas sp. IMCC34043 TaxID=2248760 RepID=UPI000E248ED2|nr:globin domain-containing protein [Tropicimonas sp. IMCC34043]
MPPSDKELALVHQSFSDLRPYLEPTSIEFYEKLFERAPHLRQLFREDLKGQGMRFMTTLGTILTDLENPGSGKVDYATLGHLHATLGVKAEHFKPMEEALMDTLRSKLGERFTPELEAAWRKAYEEFSAKLIEAGGVSD